MAVGDSADLISRLKSLVPGGWFARAAPLQRAVFGGLADALSDIFTLLMAVKAQTRIATASGWFLDLIAWDFFGPNFLRRAGETDATWRARFIGEIFRPRATRAAIEEAAILLTGSQPKIIELFNPGDCGGWDTGAFAYAGEAVPAPALSGWDDGPGGWDQPGYFAFVAPSAAIAPSDGAGCWGDTMTPGDQFQVLITVYRPPGGGTPYVAGWDTGAAGWDAGVIEWTLDEETGQVTDAQIYATIASTVAAGVTAWVAIVNADNTTEVQTIGGQFDFSTPNNSGLLPLL